MGDDPDHGHSECFIYVLLGKMDCHWLGGNANFVWTNNGSGWVILQFWVPTLASPGIGSGLLNIAENESALRLRISERYDALPKLLHGDILDASCGKPCFGLICYPISRRRVIAKCIDPLKGVIRPLGLDHPLVAVTECDVKERFFRTL
jgi:hypothetical protein